MNHSASRERREAAGERGGFVQGVRGPGVLLLPFVSLSSVSRFSLSFRSILLVFVFCCFNVFFALLSLSCFSYRSSYSSFPLVFPHFLLLPFIFFPLSLLPLYASRYFLPPFTFFPFSLPFYPFSPSSLSILPVFSLLPLYSFRVLPPPFVFFPFQHVSFLVFSCFWSCFVVIFFFYLCLVSFMSRIS